jgi:hypothetical protein
MEQTRLFFCKPADLDSSSALFSFEYLKPGFNIKPFYEIRGKIFKK